MGGGGGGGSGVRFMVNIDVMTVMLEHVHTRSTLVFSVQPNRWLTELSSCNAVILPVSLQGFTWTRDKCEYVCHTHGSEWHRRNLSTICLVKREEAWHHNTALITCSACTTEAHPSVICWDTIYNLCMWHVHHRTDSNQYHRKMKWCWNT